MLNPGWPGCCRAPQSHELDKILPADWPAVNAVYKTPIPADIKQLLDSLKQSGSPIVSPTSPTPGSYLKDVSNKAAERDRDRKNGHQQRTGGSPNGSMRLHVQKGRASVPMAGSSPQTKHARLNGPGTPPTGSFTGPTDSPSLNSNSVRRGGHAEAHIPLNRIEGFRTTPPGSTRKLNPEVDHQAQTQAESAPSQRSPTLTRAVREREGGHTPVRTSPTLLPKDGDRSRQPSPPASAQSALAQQPQLKRRDSAVRAPPQVQTSSTAKSTASLSSKATAKSSGADTVAKERDRERADFTASLEKGLKSLKITTSGSTTTTTVIPAPPSAVSDTSSDGGSRSSEGTVTSDGGFTDYLSDESDAELQRQAEVRAAIMEQNRQEDNEFRLARKQLASIDLKPPSAWTTGVTHARKAINTGYTRGN